MPPFISIVIPTYQVERQLPGALASLLAQDFMDFEVIAVDGGSSDNTILF